MIANKLDGFAAFDAAVEEVKNTAGALGGVPMASEERRAVAAYMMQAAENLSIHDAMRVRTEAEKFRACGREIRVYHCAKCNHNYKGLSSCNSRICPTCARRQGIKMLRRLRSDLRPFWAKRKNTYGPKFLTLTFKRRYDSDLPGRSDIRRAQAEVRQFVLRFYSKYAARRSRNGHWYPDRKKRRGGGAIAFAEIGKNGTLHYHVLAYGPYIPHARLVQAWQDITGDSKRVEVQDAAKLDDGCRYVTKYLTKIPAKPLSDFSLLADWAIAIKGVRRANTYGAMWGRFRKSDAVAPRVVMRCLYCGTELDYAGLGVDPDNVLIDMRLVYDHFKPVRDGPGGAWCADPPLWRDWFPGSPDHHYVIKSFPEVYGNGC